MQGASTGNFSDHFSSIEDPRSAFSDTMKLVLGQEKVADKSNEITAIPKLLEVLDLQGCTVTIDAMGCQTAIAKQIIDQKGDYLLALKSNQGTLREDVELFLASEVMKKKNSAIVDFYEENDMGHSRIETRKCYVTDTVNWLTQKEKWAGLNSLVKHVQQY